MAGALAAAGPPLLATMTDEQLLVSIDNVAAMLQEWRNGPVSNVNSEIEAKAEEYHKEVEEDGETTESAESPSTDESTATEGESPTADTPTGSTEGTPETAGTERTDTLT